MKLCIVSGCPQTAISIYPIAKVWNIPILGVPGAGASSLALDPTADRFPLLLRTTFGLSQFARSFLLLLASFNYTHVTFLRDDSHSFYQLCSKYLMNSLKTRNRA